ncbi:MAG: glycosyltransferase [Flavisolibacter sp.]
MKRKSVLLLIYNSFGDPLFQNILLSYIREIQATSTDFRFYVISFEQKDFHITSNEKQRIKAELSNEFISWHPLPYHSGKFLLLKKTWDVFQAFIKVGYLRISRKIPVIFAFANTSAVFSYFLSRLFRMRMIVYSYEPHSEFMEECGIWSKKSMKYRIFKPLEEKAGRKADVVMTGTQYMVERLKKEGARGKILRAPTAVDEKVFYFREDLRQSTRKKFGIENRKVILYIGKFGDLYYNEEVIAFFSGLYKKDNDFFFIVSTRNTAQIEEWFVKYNIPAENYLVMGYVQRDVVIELLCAADMGLNAIPPSPAQKFRSPTKVGEYLMCGLPYITCKGVSEDDIYAEKENVGVVVKELSQDEAFACNEKIQNFLKEDKQELRQRCRKVGIEYRSKYKVVEMIRQNLYELTK